MKLKFLLLLIPFWITAQTSPAGVLTSASCKIWLDAGDLNADGNYANNPAVGTAVTTWNDKSTNGNNLTQATAAAKPTYSLLGSFNTVSFDNTGANANYMTATTQAMLTPGTMYFVIRATSAGDGANCLFDRSVAGNTSVRFEQWSGTNRIGYTKYGVTDYVSTIAPGYGSNVILSYVKTAASDNIDVTQNASNNVIAVASANPGLPLYVLGKNSTVDGMNANIMEALAYSAELNRAQRNIVDNYLSAKYGGIAIPTDMYVGDTPGNGNYDYEVAGVGTDATGNNASAATSITGGLEATQATAMGNGEYLIYGHTAATNSLNTSDIAGMSAGPNKARWERIWYLDWTHVGGSVETVNLTFDYSDGGTGGNPAAPLSNYKLLYRAGLAGAWTEVMNASSIIGDRVTFNALPYTQGDGYYTIGSLDYLTSPLPLTLVKFEAEACADKICLNWSTANENNTSYFSVERSSDTENWMELLNVKAAGNSQRLKNYEAIDENPITTLAYYRLKQIDTDGSFSLSKIVAVRWDSESKFNFSIYPNPNNGEFIAEVSGAKAGTNLSVELIDQYGIVQYASDFLIENSTKSKIQINPVKKLNSGVYICRLKSGDKVYDVKMLIQ